MKAVHALLLVPFVLAGPGLAQQEPDPLQTGKDDPALPRVLLLRDSIPIGYTPLDRR